MNSIGMTKKTIGVIAIALSGALHTAVASAQTITGNATGTITQIQVQSSGQVSIVMNGLQASSGCALNTVNIPAGSTSMNQWLSLLVPARLAGNTVSISFSNSSGSASIGTCTLVIVEL
jgi:hypothetical protein